MLGIGGREARGQQQPVALAPRDIKLLGEVHDHLGARPLAAGLHEADVTSRDAGLEGQIKLREPPTVAPLTQQIPDDRVTGCDVEHRPV